MLNKYRVLDLTDEKGMFCGKILADLGAEVIKVERPGGDLARNIGPFYHDEPDREMSLFWLAYNSSKKGITLNLETKDGIELFKQLVVQSDVVIESFDPGYMDKLGIGYAQLKKLNGALVMTSITPFGQKGPYAKYKGTDIVCTAASGYMYLTGDADRAPVRMSFPFSYIQGSAHAALGTMIALFGVRTNTKGQHVDVSLQESMVPQTVNSIPYWKLSQSILKRAGQLRVGVGAGLKPRQTYRCKDGWVHSTIRGGPSHEKTNVALADWMREENCADEFFNSVKWGTLDMMKIDQDFVEKTEKPIAKFFERHTKEELYIGGVQRHIDLFPASTAEDLSKNVHLNARNFWVDIQHKKPDATMKYPASFVKSSSANSRVRPAPRIGEHNEQIYTSLLELTHEELETLSGGGVI
ncbi:MAG: CoA transferase [Dehalococcoidales bacterium]|nr:CoA transferase [Dehalococcoidales bacterium]